MSTAKQLQDLLQLRTAPVAVAFQDSPPANLPRAAKAAPSGCTFWKRAAPPDDCGGIWGYEDLVEVLADPAHSEHQDRLEWLGLTDASQFAPDAFDADAVNRRLGALR